MKHTLLFTLSFSAFSLFAQTDETYNTGFDNPEQLAHWQQFRIGAEQNEFYEWEVSTQYFHSSTSSLVHNYPVGGNDVTDDWYVSPGFDCSSGGRIDSVWTNYGGFDTPFLEDTIALYMLTGNANPELASQTTLLYSFSDSTYEIDEVWRKVESIDLPVALDSVYLAFRYTTTISWLDVRFDDLGVTFFRPVEPTGIAQPSELELTVYPNPSNGVVYINTSLNETINIHVTDMMGRTVKTQRMTSSAQITLDQGMYHVSAIAASGERASQVIVVNE